jgi:hypothetical protein
VSECSSLSTGAPASVVVLGCASVTAIPPRERVFRLWNHPPLDKPGIGPRRLISPHRLRIHARRPVPGTTTPPRRGRHPRCGRTPGTPGGDDCARPAARTGPDARRARFAAAGRCRYTPTARRRWPAPRRRPGWQGHQARCDHRFAFSGISQELDQSETMTTRRGAAACAGPAVMSARPSPRREGPYPCLDSWERLIASRCRFPGSLTTPAGVPGCLVHP